MSSEEDILRELAGGEDLTDLKKEVKGALKGVLTSGLPEWKIAQLLGTDYNKIRPQDAKAHPRYTKLAPPPPVEERHDFERERENKLALGDKKPQLDAMRTVSKLMGRHVSNEAMDPEEYREQLKSAEAQFSQKTGRYAEGKEAAVMLGGREKALAEAQVEDPEALLKEVQDLDSKWAKPKGFIKDYKGWAAGRSAVGQELMRRLTKVDPKLADRVMQEAPNLRTAMVERIAHFAGLNARSHHSPQAAYSQRALDAAGQEKWAEAVAWHSAAGSAAAGNHEAAMKLATRAEAMSKPDWDPQVPRSEGAKREPKTATGLKGGGRGTDVKGLVKEARDAGRRDALSQLQMGQRRANLEYQLGGGRKLKGEVESNIGPLREGLQKEAALTEAMGRHVEGLPLFKMAFQGKVERLKELLAMSKLRKAPGPKETSLFRLALRSADAAAKKSAV